MARHCRWVALLGVLGCAQTALAVSGSLVISAVYGGGGSTANPTYRNDYVEVFNLGTTPVPLGGKSIQYASAEGTGWSMASLAAVTLQPGQYHLVQLGTPGTAGAALPTPDTTSTALNLSNASGKVALVDGTAALSGVCPTVGVIDLVGYGAANCFEGAATPTLSITTAATRLARGCVETDLNAADFVIVPNPIARNSGTPLAPCSRRPTITLTTSALLPDATVNQAFRVALTAAGGAGGPYTFEVVAPSVLPGFLTLANGALSGTPTTTDGSPFTFLLLARDRTSMASAPVALTLRVLPAPEPVCDVTHVISGIQGSGTISVLLPTVASNAAVTTRGVVTAVRSTGFFLQSLASDVDNREDTSEGIFVFTGSALGGAVTSVPPAVAVRNVVCVSGRVTEFRPGSAPNRRSITQIQGTATTVLTLTLLGQEAALPTPVVLTEAETDPLGGLDVLEELEGMRVRVDSLTVIAPTEGNVNEAAATATTNGTFYGVVTGVARPRRTEGISLLEDVPLAAGTSSIPRFDTNPERLRIASLGQVGVAGPINVAAGTVLTDVVGVLDYSFDTYTIYPDPMLGPVVGSLPSPRAVPVPTDDEFTVATFNVERLFDDSNSPRLPGSDEPVLSPAALSNRLGKLSLLIRDFLRMPDILSINEAENLSVLRTLAARINRDAAAAGQDVPEYEAYLEEGNDIGGIDSGFLVKRARVEVLGVQQVNQGEVLFNPRTGQPYTHEEDGLQVPDLLNDRPPLVLRAVVRRSPAEAGLPLTVISNHLRSLSGVTTLNASGDRVRDKRRAQAESLARLIQLTQASNPNVNLLSMGDYNAYELNDGYVDVIGTVLGTPAPPEQVTLTSPDLVTPNLTNLVLSLPLEERYSFLFDGNVQVLDHALASQALARLFTRAAYARVNADFPEALRGVFTRPERVSDHDPLVTYFRLP